ncbi:MAG: DUF4386 domain-containing protein [Acidaminobacteraceae bacterium]
MNTIRKERKLEITAGISFFIATLSYGIGNSIITESLNLGDFSSTSLGLGVLLELINSFAVIAIGLLLYARLRSKNESVMLGYAFSRLAEALLLIVGSISVLFAPIIIGDNKAAMLIQSHEMFFSIGMLVLGIYSTFFCLYLFKTSNAPKLLMLIGAIGYISTIIYGVINILSLSPSASMILFATGAIFEIGFPIWLIAKGFDKC